MVARVERPQPGTFVIDNMVFVPGGAFRMGSDRHYPEEAPAHRVAVDGFWIDRTPVTNAQFNAFVTATGYVTSAERVPLAADYPGTPPEMLQPASLVFAQPKRLRLAARLETMVGASVRSELETPPWQG